MAEALNGTFKAELIEMQGPWRDCEQVERAIFQWVTWYDEERLHSALDYVPPAEYEHDFWRARSKPRSPPEPSRSDSTKVGAAHRQRHRNLQKTNIRNSQLLHQVCRPAAAHALAYVLDLVASIPALGCDQGHAYRVKHLEEQADAWHQTKRLTEYVTAVRDHATSLPPGQKRGRDRGVARLRGCPPPTPRRVRRSAEAALPTEAQRRRPQAFPRPLEPVRTPLLLIPKPGHNRRPLTQEIAKKEPDRPHPTHRHLQKRPPGASSERASNVRQNGLTCVEYASRYRP
ncbi:integrase core domain-containing protein [Streptomyces flavofungini]|uniref:integrase core domain-containing protein n=1 Tax=Streptomyces flavofungini TaxID=68200 RepID=UPI0035576CC2